MKTDPFDALQKPLEAERQWLLIAASAATLLKRGVDGELLFSSPPETPEGRVTLQPRTWRGNQQRRGLAASAADFVSQTRMFSSAARLRIRSKTTSRFVSCSSDASSEHKSARTRRPCYDFGILFRTRS